MNPQMQSGSGALESPEELLEESPSGYLYARTDGLIVRVNATFLRWTGYSREDLVERRRFADLLTVPGRMFYETHVAPAKQMHGFINELALDVTCADGRLLPALVSVAQKRDPDGQPIFDRVLVFNATERRRYEKELLIARENADRVAVELAEVNAALKRSNEELVQFAQVASHDLQAPLRTITMYIDLFMKRYRDKVEPAAQGLLSRIVEGATRMQALIGDLLSLSRTETSPEPRWVELDRVVGVALTHLTAAVLETGAQVHRRDLPSVMVDPSRLGELFQNLIGNAIKYRQPGRAPVIAVSATPGAGEWEISVADNGRGFDPARSEDIFRAFRRLHGSEIAGTGIGLAICRKIVESHGGRIWATSVPGEGSIFFFTLPVIPAASPPTPPQP